MNNRLSKKFLSRLLTVFMLGALPMQIAMAASYVGDEPSSPSGDQFTSNDSQMTVEYVKDNSYIVTIPADVTFRNETTGISGQISASSISIDPTKKVQVKVSDSQEDLTDEGVLTLTRINETDSKTVNTNVTLSGAGSITEPKVKRETVVAEFEGDSEAPSYGGTLNFSATEDSDGDSVINAGSYQVVMTFTTEVTNKT